MSLTVYRFGPALGEPDVSPFCTKLLTWLQMAGLDYDTAPFDPRKAPRGKAPFVDYEGEVLADSAHIIRHLQQAEGVDLDEGLTAAQRATARLLQSMLEEHLYFVMLYNRWQVPEVWERYKPTIGASVKASGAPGLLVPLAVSMAHRSAVKSLHGQGTGRHTLEQVVATGLELLEAAEATVGEGPWVFGDRPATIDATAFAVLSACLTDALPTPLGEAAEGRFEGLRAYCDGVRAALFPELADADVDEPSAQHGA